jgi:transmembrane sensor
VEKDAVNDKQVKQRSRTARAEASVWIVRLHGPHRTPELEAGFRAWLAASPENARQFERVTEVWDAGAVPVAGVPRVAHDPQPSASRASRLGYTAYRNAPRRWAALAAALALVIIGAGGWYANTFWLNPHYTTDIGERRVLRLSDGSRVTLNSDSGVVVSYRFNERRISIDHGEAYFEVERDSSRPFVVRAGDEQIEALGTSFVVRREPRQLMVTLVEGKVAVSDSDSSTPGTTLAEGQRLTVTDSGSAKLDEPRIEAVIAWLRGEVILDRTSLTDAVAEMNRYDQRRLVIDDPSIAAMRISGVYHTGDSELFASMVARLYGLGVQRRRDGRIHLSPARPDVTAEN